MPSAARKWGATYSAVIVAAAAIVPAWSRWLNEQQTVRQPVDEDETEGSKDNSTLAPREWIFYRPTSLKDLAQGFGTTFAYLAALDVLVARKAVDQTSRFFILHTLANVAITMSSAPDAARSLAAPMHDCCGKMSILPVYRARAPT